MKKIYALLFCCCAITFSACAQNKQSTEKQTPKKTTKMDTNKLTNQDVKKAFNAWQNGDAKLWLSFFTDDAKLFDDGNPRDFKRFVSDACGNEKFTTIDKVENNGTAIFGNFHTKSWGDFKTYFKFTPDGKGKFSKLEIGQAN